MPIYEYECENCSTHFEVRRSFHDTSMEYCPQCNSKSRRLFRPAAIIFKGSGFYVTDSRKEVSPPVDASSPN